MLAKTKWIYELLEKHFSEEYAQYLYVLSIATYLSKHKELNLIKYRYEGDYLSILYPDLDMEEGDIRYVLRKFEKEKSAIEEFKKELFNMSTGRILIFVTNFGVILNRKTDKLNHLRVAIISDLDSGCILDYVPSDYHELDYTKHLISALKKRDIEGKTFILNYIYHQKNIQDYIRKKGGKCISFYYSFEEGFKSSKSFSKKPFSVKWRENESDNVSFT